MAKYTIIHRCGHRQMYELYGKMNERLRRLREMKPRSCSACLREEYEAENEASAKHNAENNLPELQGTDRQKPWAETIRKDRLEETKEFLESLIQAGRGQLESGGISQQEFDEAEARYRERFRLLQEMKDAHWWIERRRDDATTLLEAIKREA